jgi:hypothetical protein
MAYIGQSIKNGTFSVLDTSGNTYNGSNVTFSLGTQVGSPAQLLVSHDGVIQKAGTDYSLASGGTQITFSTAPASGASIFIVEISGAVGGPLDSDLNGNELILDADGDTSITADTDDQIDVKIGGTDQFSVKDGVIEPTTDNDVDIGSTSKEFKDGYFDGTLHCDVLDLAGTEYSSIGISNYWNVKRSGNQSISQSTTTTVTWNQTVVAQGVTNSASSDGRFTIGSGQAGWYVMHAISRYADGPTDGKERVYIQHYDTSASSTELVGYGEMNTKGTYDTVDAHALAYLDVGDYVYVQVWQNNDSSANFIGSNGTGFMGYKIA